MHTWRALHDAWWRLATQPQPRSLPDALALSFLRAGSAGYSGAVAARNAAYDRGWLRAERLPVPVVSVGNLTVGGTGKTACVELVVRKLQARSQRVAVLSRGYGGRFTMGSAGCLDGYSLRAQDGRLTVNGSSLASTEGLPDEPQLLAQHLDGVTVGVGRDRAAIGRQICRATACDVVVLDDGFQHRRLHRDCDIVLIHARTPLDGWPMLPRGPMREPLTALKRAQVIVVTKIDEAWQTPAALTERLRAFNRNAAIATAVHEASTLVDTSSRERHEPGRLAGMRVGLLSGIGDPEGFEAMARRLHATVLWHRAFPDHHRYSAAEMATLREHADQMRPDAVLTTEKDWIRLRTMDYGRWTAPIWIFGVRMRIIEGEEALDARLAAVYTR